MTSIWPIKTRINKKGYISIPFPIPEQNIIFYCKPLTNLVNFDLLLEALFLWITFFFARRSSIETTFNKRGDASSLEVVLRNCLIALRVVFAW